MHHVQHPEASGRSRQLLPLDTVSACSGTERQHASRHAAHLPLGIQVSQVLILCERALEGGCGGNVGGQPHGLAHVGSAGQQQEVAGEQGRQVLQRDGSREEQGGGHAEALHTAQALVGWGQCLRRPWNRGMPHQHQPDVGETLEAEERLDSVV